MNQDSINNRYTLIKPIGQGAYGSVFQAVSKQTEAMVAIKIISLQSSNQRDIINEISALSLLSAPSCNPYIVCYYESFIDPIEQTVNIVMEYVDGPNVMEYTQPLRDSGNYQLLNLTARLLLIAMLSGLQYIHSRGLIHNDIKPSNIVVGKNQIPVLVDFGISCVTKAAINEICTKPYQKIISDCCEDIGGTPFYLPPEILKDVKYFQSDLWSLGSSVYSIVTGNNIWSIDSTQYSSTNLLAQIVDRFNNNVLPNRLFTDDQTLNTIVNSFLQYDPAARMSIDEAIQLLINY